jgi:cobalt-zinc-cadmium resistance protein CzcA
LPKTNISGTFGQLNSANFDQSFSISQQFNPALFKAKKQMLTAQYQASKIDSVAAADGLKLEIRKAYNDVVYYESLLNVWQKQDSLLENFAKRAEVRATYGEATLIEKTTAENKWLHSNVELQKLERLVVIVKSKQALLMSDPDGAYDVKVPVLKRYPVVDESSSYLKDNPTIQNAKQEIEVAKGEIKMNKADAFPEITAGYFIQSFRGEQVVDGQLINYDATPQFQGFSVGLSIPIFYRANKAKIEMANTAVLMETEHAEYVEEQLAYQMAFYEQERVSLKQELDFYEYSALPNADLILEKAQVTYESGEIGYIEYMQALQTVLEINKNHLLTVKNYNESVFSVKYLINQ